MGPSSESTRRRFIKVGGAAGVVGLSGCLGGGDGGGGGGDDGGDGGDGDGGSNGGSTGNGGSGDPVELEFWHIFGNVLGGHLEDVITPYNEMDNGVQVNLTSQGGYGENFNATMSAVNAGNAPHITQFASGDSTSAIDSGGFVPVEDYLGDRMDWDSLITPVVDYFSIDGTWHSLPMNNSTAIMQYNKDMFAEAGLDPEAPPTTMAEVREVSQTLVDETEAREGCAWANVTWFVNQWTAIDQEFVYNEKNGREGEATEILLETETAERIYNWWYDMHQDGLYMNTQQGWGDASGAAFQSRRVGMILGSTAGLGRTADLAAEAEPSFEVGGARLMSPHDSFHGAQVGGGSLWLPESSATESEEVREALTDFLLWITGPEPQAEWHKKTGYFAINEEAITTLEDDGWFEENPAWRVGYEQLEASASDEYTQAHGVATTGEVGNLRMDLWTSLAQGNPPTESLPEYKQQIDSALTR